MSESQKKVDEPPYMTIVLPSKAAMWLYRDFGMMRFCNERASDREHFVEQQEREYGRTPPESAPKQFNRLQGLDLLCVALRSFSYSFGARRETTGM